MMDACQKEQIRGRQAELGRVIQRNETALAQAQQDSARYEATLKYSRETLPPIREELRHAGYLR